MPRKRDEMCTHRWCVPKGERARSLARACRDKQRGQKTRKDHNREARRSECDARFVHDCARYAADIRDEASPCPERILHIRNVSRVYIYLIQYHLTILYYYYSTLHHRGIMYYVFGGSPLASSRSIRRSVGLACRPPLIARQSIITSRQCRIFFSGPRYLSILTIPIPSPLPSPLSPAPISIFLYAALALAKLTNAGEWCWRCFSFWISFLSRARSR
jgi:hypothetical protein